MNDSFQMSTKDYDLPAMMSDVTETEFMEMDELTTETAQEDYLASTNLNMEQEGSFRITLDHAYSNKNGSVLFIYGLGWN